MATPTVGGSVQLQNLMGEPHDLNLLGLGYKVPAKMNQAVVPEQYLPEIGVGTLPLTSASLKIKSSASLGRGIAEAPDAGYRYMYIDELAANPDLQVKVRGFLKDWDIVVLLNGWTEGRGYGSKIVKDRGARTIMVNILQISADFPVQGYPFM